MLDDLPDIDDLENNNYIYSTNNQIMPTNTYEKYKTNIRQNHVIPVEAGMTRMNYEGSYTPINYQQPNIMYYQQPVMYRENFENNIIEANVDVEEDTKNSSKISNSNKTCLFPSSPNIYLVIIIILLTIILILLLYIIKFCKTNGSNQLSL